MKREDVTIDFRQDRFAISGQATAPSELDEYTVRERKSGKFSRSVKLARDIKVGFYFALMCFYGVDKSDYRLRT